jgi:hypothetical protein
MRALLIAAALLTVGGCAAGSEVQGSGAAAALRGFGVEVDQAVAPQVPMVHLKTCGSWGCHEQDVPLHIAGPTSAMPCPRSAAPEVSCGMVNLPGPGPGYGYAPVPALTFDQVTVTVTTPSEAPFPINAEVPVRPAAVCPQDQSRPGNAAASSTGSICPGATPQAQLRIAATGTVSQSR